MKTRVLNVDDHRVFRDGLKAVINHKIDMVVVGEAEDGKKAVATTLELTPDVILMVPEVLKPVITHYFPPLQHDCDQPNTSGRMAVTTVPVPGVDTILRLPPIAVRRSRML